MPPKRGTRPPLPKPVAAGVGSSISGSPQGVLLATTDTGHPPTTPSKGSIPTRTIPPAQTTTAAAAASVGTVTGINPDFMLQQSLNQKSNLRNFHFFASRQRTIGHSYGFRPMKDPMHRSILSSCCEGNAEKLFRALVQTTTTELGADATPAGMPQDWAFAVPPFFPAMLLEPYPTTTGAVPIGGGPQVAEVEGNSSLVEWTEAELLVRNVWLRLAALEFVERRNIFDSHVGLSKGSSATSSSGSTKTDDDGEESRGGGGSLFRFTLKYGTALVLFMMFLIHGWPLWGFLFDMRTPKNYVTLEVEPTATTVQIKKSYRTLVKIWHPDHNPTCGAPCRNKMMEIQKAYDEILKLRQTQGDGGGGGASAEVVEQQNQVKGLMHQIISFTFWRGFDMAKWSILFISYWVEVGWQRFFTQTAIGAKLIPLVTRGVNKKKFSSSSGGGGNSFSSSGRSTAAALTERLRAVVLMVKVTLLALFVGLSLWFVTGFDLVFLGMTAMRFLDLVKPNSKGELRQIRNHLHKKNFDAGWAVAIFVFPAVLYHTLYFFLWDPYPRTDTYFYHLAFGLVYMIGQFTQTAPNIFDNLRMMQCTVPDRYLAANPGGRGASITIMSVLWAESGFLLDDLFAFATEIPAVYRFTVIVVHVIFLMEFYVLPSHVTLRVSGGRGGKRKVGGRNHRRLLRSAAATTVSSSPVGDEGERSTELLDEKVSFSEEEDSDSDVEEGGETIINKDGTTRKAGTFLTTDETRMVVKLDNSVYPWFVMAQAVYPRRFQRLMGTLEARRVKDQEVAQRGGAAGAAGDNRPIEFQLPSEESGHLLALPKMIVSMDQQLHIPHAYLPPRPSSTLTLGGEPFAAVRARSLKAHQEKLVGPLVMAASKAMVVATLLLVLLTACASHTVSLLSEGCSDELSSSTAFEDSGSGEPLRDLVGLKAPHLHPEHPINRNEGDVKADNIVLFGSCGLHPSKPTLVSSDPTDSIRAIYAGESGWRKDHGIPSSFNHWGNSGAGGKNTGRKGGKQKQKKGGGKNKKGRNSKK